MKTKQSPTGDRLQKEDDDNELLLSIVAIRAASLPNRNDIIQARYSSSLQWQGMAPDETPLSYEFEDARKDTNEIDVDLGMDYTANSPSRPRGYNPKDSQPGAIRVAGPLLLQDDAQHVMDDESQSCSSSSVAQSLDSNCTGDVPAMLDPLDAWLVEDVEEDITMAAEASHSKEFSLSSSVEFSIDDEEGAHAPPAAVRVETAEVSCSEGFTLSSSAEFSDEVSSSLSVDLFGVEDGDPAQPPARVNRGLHSWRGRRRGWNTVLVQLRMKCQRKCQCLMWSRIWQEISRPRTWIV